MRFKQHREKIMPLLSRLFSLWRNLFHKARMEQEITDEIDAYLEMLIEQKIKEGLAPEDARRAALIELGGRQQVKEKVWEVSLGNQLQGMTLVLIGLVLGLAVSLAVTRIVASYLFDTSAIDPGTF